MPSAAIRTRRTVRNHREEKQNRYLHTLRSDGSYFGNYFVIPAVFRAAKLRLIIYDGCHCLLRNRRNQHYGGKGRLWGTFIGALIIGIIDNGMTLLGISTNWQYIVKGAIIIIAVGLDSIREK